MGPLVIRITGPKAVVCILLLNIRFNYHSGVDLGCRAPFTVGLKHEPDKFD